MLDIQGLAISFVRYDGLFARRRLPCLSGISTAVAAGEMLAVVGASGAGKSLLAHAVLGILPPNADVGGHMSFDGAALTPARQKRLRGRRIALVPQSITHLDPLVRSFRQVGWAARRAGLAGAHAVRAAEQAIGRYGLDRTAAELYPHALSGGMARRILLAIATVAEADLVIADEPTSGLDPANAEVVLAHLRTLADRGKAVVVITHDIPAVLRYADRVTVLCGGTCIETAPAEAFAGDGTGLTTDFARALWRALPQNAFTDFDAAVPVTRVA